MHRISPPQSFPLFLTHFTTFHVPMVGERAYLATPFVLFLIRYWYRFGNQLSRLIFWNQLSRLILQTHGTFFRVHFVVERTLRALPFVRTRRRWHILFYRLIIFTLQRNRNKKVIMADTVTFYICVMQPYIGLLQ